MRLDCQKCGEEFENANTIGYCDDCRASYDAKQRARSERQETATQAAGAFHIAGKWGDAKESPRSAWDEISQRQVCGMCGSSELEPGYGYAGGFGLGSYQFCLDCCVVQDFSEDLE
jgi:NMD protein affecting ribosome stability and mRNA decay